MHLLDPLMLSQWTTLDEDYVIPLQEVKKTGLDGCAAKLEHQNFCIKLDYFFEELVTNSYEVRNKSCSSFLPTCVQLPRIIPVWFD